VRAMPKKIEEIERFLKFVDLPLDGDEYTPVVVLVKNTDAGEVMNLVKQVISASSSDSASTPSSASRRAKSAAARRRARKGKSKSTPKAAAPLSTDDLTMLHWEPANSIILIGAEEAVEEARLLIDRFDVVSDVEMRFVDAQNRPAEEVCELTTTLLEATMGDTPQLTCTAEPNDRTMILSGPARELTEALSIIAKVDTQAGIPDTTVHTVTLECMLPSQMIGLLNSIENSSSPAPKPTKRRKGRKSTPRRRTSTSGKFHPDDMNRTLRVICTDEEWEEDYREIIARLDEESCAQPAQEILPIAHLSHQDAVTQLQGYFASREGGPPAPTMMAVPRGVMVVGATPLQMTQIKQFLAQVDVDPLVNGMLERRAFDLINVEPADIIPVLEALVASPATASKPAPQPRKRKGRKNRASNPATGTADQDITFVEYGSRLWVTAPGEDMERIAALIEELDTPMSEREMRPYDFEPGTNVTELANMLRALFAEESRVVAGGKAARGKRRSKARATASAGDDGILFIPQPELRRLFVSAAVERFPEIEEAIELLRPSIDRQGHAPVVKFITIDEVSPDTVVSIIEPIMAIRINELVERGELPDPGKDRGSLLHMSSDTAASRLIVTAPQVLIPQIEELIEQIENGEVEQERTELVKLEYTPASEMAETIKTLISGASSTPAKKAAPVRRSRRGRRRPQPAKSTPPARSTAAITGAGVTVIPLASEDKLLVRGPESGVTEVLEWIAMLDQPDNGGMQMRVHQLALADVEQLADQIMELFDPGGKPQSKGDEEDPFDIVMGGPRVGQEIRLTSDFFTNTLVVWASPRKHAQIEEFIELYEKGDIPSAVEGLPRKEIKLNYADAYDAMYELQDFIDALWSGDKPKVDYIPFTSMLVIKSRNLDTDVPRIREILAEHIDLPGKAESITIEREAVTGAAVDDVVMELLLRYGHEFEIEIEGIEPAGSGGHLQELRPPSMMGADPAPCVLPSAVFHSVEAALAVVSAQAASDADAETPENADDAPATKDPDDTPPVDRVAEMLQRAQRDETAPADDAPAEQPPAKPKIKIRLDRRNNVANIEGLSRHVSDIRERLREIMEAREEAATGAPDIRVWVLEHLDPNAAAQVLEAMFNASSPRSRAMAQARQQAQQRAQQQAAARRKNQQQKNQAAQQGNEGEGDKGKDPRGGKGQQAQAPKVAAPQPSISVFPYAPLRAIIIKAPTEMYPAIEELVATIDRPTPSTNEFRFFQVKSQTASVVEEQLKIIFNIDQSKQPVRRTAARGRGNQAAAAQQVQALMNQQIDLAALGDQASEIGSTASISITSNDDTNTVLVRGPKPVLDLAEEIIDKIEEHAPEPLIERQFVLTYADATTVVPQLKQIFPLKGPDSDRPDAVKAIFVDQPVSNAVMVRARERDFARIESVITMMDTSPGETDKALSVAVTCGDAVKFAKLLEKIYGMGRRGKESAKKVQFVGDDAGNTVVFTAPEELREEITRRITGMDEAACGNTKPRFIQLTSAKAERVAKVVEEAFGGGRKSRIRVSGDDTTRQLVVTCPDEIYPQIERFARTLDVPPTGLEMRTYKLKFARASTVLDQMNKMVRQLVQQLRNSNVQLDPFSASANDRSNTLTVMGGPMTFAVVEKFLSEVDIESEDTTVETLVVALDKTRAREVANTIRRLFPRPENGIDPPKAEANDSTNTILVRGTKAQLERINNEVIKKLEEFSDPGQKREPRVYAVVNAEINGVRNAIANAFRMERGAAESERVDVAVENATQSVIVTAKRDKHDEVAKLIQALDQELDPKTQRTTHVVELKEANAEDLARRLSDMINRTKPRRGGTQRMAVVADPGTNNLLVFANQKELNEVKELLQTLDLPPSFEPEIRSFKMTFAEADATRERHRRTCSGAGAWSQRQSSRAGVRDRDRLERRTRWW
jgi:type II secretory pathway component GspD/PulD (secretin)